MDFSKLFIPYNVKLRFLLFQLFEFLKHLVNITVLGKQNPVI